MSRCTTPVIYTTGRHGCWFGCGCGIQGPRRSTHFGASLSWAEHIRDDRQNDTKESR